MVDEGLSAQTVCRIGHSAGLRALKLYIGHILTDRHRNERRHWAGRYRYWRLQRWHGVLFSNNTIR